MRKVMLIALGFVTLLVSCESEEKIRKREQNELRARQDSIRNVMAQRADAIATRFIDLYLKDEEGVDDTLWSMLSEKSTKGLPQKSMRGVMFALKRRIWQRTHGVMDYSKGYGKPSDTEFVFDTAWIVIDSSTFLSDSVEDAMEIWYSVHALSLGLRTDPSSNYIIIIREQDTLRVYIGEADEWEGL